MKKTSYISILLCLIFLFTSTAIKSQWEVQNSGTTKNLYGICLIDSLNVWITTHTSQYLQTKDGGKNWELKEIEGEDYLKSIFFVNKEVGYAIAGLGKIYSTKNGGDTWEAYDSTYDYSFQDIYFIDENNGWIVGYIVSSETQGKGIILHTSDGGKTWETQFEKEVFERSMLIFFASIQMKDENMGWAISPYNFDAFADTRVFKTDDGGKNWIELKNHLPLITYKLRIAKNDTLWTGGRYRGNFSASTDGGENWQNIDWSNNYTANVSPYTGKIGWMASQHDFNDSTSQLYFTKDMGSTWQQELEITGRIWDIENKDGYLWMVGYNGLIMRKKIDFTTSVEKQEELPASFEVYQNYPNPFNPETTIKYYVPYSATVKIEIFDILGRLISTYNPTVEIGNNFLRWNAETNSRRKLSSGIYFCQISIISSKFTSHKITLKMMYAK